MKSSGFLWPYDSYVLCKKTHIDAFNRIWFLEGKLYGLHELESSTMMVTTESGITRGMSSKSEWFNNIFDIPSPNNNLGWEFNLKEDLEGAMLILKMMGCNIEHQVNEIRECIVVCYTVELEKEDKHIVFQVYLDRVSNREVFIKVIDVKNSEFNDYDNIKEAFQHVVSYF